MPKFRCFISLLLLHFFSSAQGKFTPDEKYLIRRNEQGKYEFFPIVDEVNVNKRRASVGLPPLEEYAKYFGVEYVLPKK